MASNRSESCSEGKNTASPLCWSELEFSSSPDLREVENDRKVPRKRSHSQKSESIAALNTCERDKLLIRVAGGPKRHAGSARSDERPRLCREELSSRSTNCCLVPDQEETRRTSDAAGLLVKGQPRWRTMRRSVMKEFD